MSAERREERALSSDWSGQKAATTRSRLRNPRRRLRIRNTASISSFGWLSSRTASGVPPTSTGPNTEKRGGAGDSSAMTECREESGRGETLGVVMIDWMDVAANFPPSFSPLRSQPMHRQDTVAPELLPGRTDTPLEMPTMRRSMTVLSRVLRLRCPHCGTGPVLEWNGGVRERCSSCGLRYQRGDRNYFFGAVFFGVMLGELLFAASFATILISMWPNVPWDLIQWALPVGVLVAAPLFIPFSKLVFVSVDVMVRPVLPSELE